MKEMSQIIREKMRISALKRDNSNRIKALPRGEKHWSWSLEPNKLTLHKRIHRKHGPASQHKCFDCDRKAHDWSNESGNYTDNIIDYRPRCRSCHVKKDKNWQKK